VPVGLCAHRDQITSHFRTDKTNVATPACCCRAARQREFRSEPFIGTRTWDTSLRYNGTRGLISARLDNTSCNLESEETKPRIVSRIIRFDASRSVRLFRGSRRDSTRVNRKQIETRSEERANTCRLFAEL